MTKEDAKQWIESIKRKYIHGGVEEFDYKRKIALDMAIEALQQEPCEDAISRQKVNILVDELARAISDERCCMPRGRSTGAIMQDILDLPPVNPQKPICPSAGIDCEDCPAYEKKSEWQHDHEILKAYSDGASAVLDKIRTEIAALGEGISSYHNDRPWVFKDEVLQIIDKYKAEGSDKE